MVPGVAKALQLQQAITDLHMQLLSEFQSSYTVLERLNEEALKVLRVAGC